VGLGFIVAAFALGFAVARVGLPPLVGYLAAGFVLHGFGYESTPVIDLLADFGVLLLLFGIGLKLRLSTLARGEVWAGGSVHVAVTTGLMGALFLALGASGVPLAADLGIGGALVIGFAFSFSSTVYAVKALEERGESASLPGRIAVGILIIQDLFAVGFLAFAAAETPSVWAPLVVIAVLAARPLYGWVLERTGHGELLVLLGFVLAIGVGAGSFDLVGLKPDLGALVVGLLLASHERAPELANRLLGYKDLLLIGFFLSIGLDGTPDVASVTIAVVALLVLPLKVAGFVALIPRFGIRARTALHSAITLGTFSEFGLIVVTAGIEEGLLDGDWAAAVAVAVAVSFAIAAPANAARYRIYATFDHRLDPLERHPLVPEEATVDPGDARIIIFGMGRVGTGAYDEFIRREGDVILGVDRSDAVVRGNVAAGRRCVPGDALDADFWERVCLALGLELVVLAMNDHSANLEAVRRVKTYLPGVQIAAAATYADQVVELHHAGVDVARNLLEEAGQGLADDACDLLYGRRGGE
jgi:glutathione-regulated potassium-efflux system ancillary protein KefC